MTGIPGRSEIEIEIRNLFHMLRRGLRKGDVKPGLEALAKEMANIFADIAQCEADGTPETGNAILRDAVEAFDKDEGEDKETKQCDN